MSGALGVNGHALGWAFGVRTAPDCNIGFYGNNEFGCINDAGSAWIPMLMPAGLTVNGDVSSNRGNDTGYHFFGTSGARYIGWDSANFQLQGGQLVIGGPLNCYGITCQAINTQGNTINASVVQANNASNSSHFQLYNTETGHLRYIRMQAGDIDFVNNGYSASTQTLYNSGDAAKIGGGVWAVLSDSRIKTVTGDYTTGLETLLSLNVRKFVYKGNESSFDPITVERRDGKPNDTVPYFSTMHHDVALEGREFVGLVAQEAEVVLPELVKKLPGWIDAQPVEDLRMMDNTNLIYVAINAIGRAWSATNDALTARIAALEKANGV